MFEHPTIYQLACELHDGTGFPVFPVRLTQNAEGRWQKMPLVKWGSFSGDPREISWRNANAIGVPMGRRSGLLAIDLDDYKDGSRVSEWLNRHRLPRTQTHGTASGGRHLIYRLPDGVDLGNNAPAVTGIDVRGNGGFIVWADVDGRYDVLDDAQPALLPESICEELQDLQPQQYGTPLSDADLPVFRYVNREGLNRKLSTALADVADQDLRARFYGLKKGLKDKSRSGMDMSLAGLLALRGFDFSEIVQTLLEHFEHGTTARDGQNQRTERAAERCAARAIQGRARKTHQQMELLRRTLDHFQTKQEDPQEFEQ